MDTMQKKYGPMLFLFFDLLMFIFCVCAWSDLDLCVLNQWYIFGLFFPSNKIKHTQADYFYWINVWRFAGLLNWAGIF